MSGGKIYFVSAPGRIKIGYTAQPDKRLASLQHVDMERLTTIGVAPGTMRIERKLHEMVGNFRIRGEWFRDCEEVRKLADDYLTGRLVLDKFGEEPVAPGESEPLRSSRDVFLDALRVQKEACSEVERLLTEAGFRAARGEPFEDLERAALFLGRHVIAPIAYGYPADTKSQQ